MRPCNLIVSLGLILVVTCFAASGAWAQSETLQINSPAFENGASIDEQFTCKGADKSPRLKWSGVASATRALALIVDDPDAPHGTFVHWVVYNLPPGAQGLPEGVPRGERLSGGGSQGANGFGKIGYNGPCPPPGKLHHYHFRLFALDQEVNPGPTPDASALENAMTGHVKASAEVVATFSR